MRHRSVGKALGIALALFGIWSLYVQATALVRAGFAALKALSFLPILGAAALLLFVARERRARSPQADACAPETTAAPWISVPQWLWLAGAALIAGLYWGTRSEWLFWVLSTVFLFAVGYVGSFGSSARPVREAAIGRWELWGLLGLCGIGVLLGLGANRPNADDAYYVSLASSAIDHPEAPLFGFDNTCKSGMPLLQQHLHFGQAYEYLIAALAAFTHVPVRALYYAALPALCLPMGLLAHWVLLRRWLPAWPAMVGLASVVVLFAVWGDGVCTYGSFAFVRIFQGKSIFIVVAVPLIVHAALEYLDRPSWLNWLVLMLQQCAAVGLTTTAQLMAPLASAFVLLAGLELSRERLRAVVTGLFASSPVVLTAAAMTFLLRSWGFGQDMDRLLGYPIVLGSSRTSLVLLGLLLLPVLARMAGLREARWLCRYVLLCSALLLCPAVPALMSMYLARVLGWRVFWSWPVPLLLGLTIGAASCRSLGRPWLRGGLLAIALATFVAAGPSAVSRQNWSWSNVGAFKVPGDYAVAERLMSLAPKDGLALVPEGLAVSLCGFQNAPPLVAVRRTYLEELHGAIPEQDWTARLDLLAYIGGAADRRPLDWVTGEIDRRGVTTVAFRKTHPDAEPLLSGLSARGFQMTRHGGYWLATRSASVK